MLSNCRPKYLSHSLSVARKCFQSHRCTLLHNCNTWSVVAFSSQKNMSLKWFFVHGMTLKTTEAIKCSFLCMLCVCVENMHFGWNVNRFVLTVLSQFVTVVFHSAQPTNDKNYENGHSCVCFYRLTTWKYSVKTAAKLLDWNGMNLKEITTKNLCVCTFIWSRISCWHSSIWNACCHKTYFFISLLSNSLSLTCDNIFSRRQLFKYWN